MFWKALKMMLKRFGPDKWCRNHKMEGFSPKKRTMNDSNQLMEPDYSATQVKSLFFFKSIFSACEKTIFSCCSKKLWREIYILSLLCVQKCMLDSTWTYSAYKAGIVFWIIMIKLEIFFLFKCHPSQSACLPQQRTADRCFTQLKRISHGSGSLRPRGQQDSVSGQSSLLACRRPLCVLTCPSLSVCTCEEGVLTISIRGLPLWPYLTSISPQNALSPSSK